MIPSLTLEQARTVVAVAQAGSFAKAAAKLNKVHSAVVYSLRTLEESLGVALFDRTGYRSELTPLGRRVVEQCEALLAAAGEIEDLCAAARGGEEPSLSLVYDGLLPAPAILKAVRVVAAKAPATRISLFSEFLGDVEARYERDAADLMITIVPPSTKTKRQLALAPLPSSLVVAAEHALAKQKRPVLRDLEAHTFLTVRGSDERLRMSTSALEKVAVFRLSDFHAKKAALLAGMGYGWMPDYLIEGELARKKLVVVRFGDDGGRHVFKPTLVQRGAGKVASALAAALAGPAEA